MYDKGLGGFYSCGCFVFFVFVHIFGVGGGWFLFSRVLVGGLGGLDIFIGNM